MDPSEKIIYTIGDAARIADVKAYVLRYWESEFERLRPEKSVTGQRCYRPKDIRIVLTLKRLLHQEGFTIAGARKKISEMGDEDWDAFPSSEETNQSVDFPAGRSVEGTVDDPANISEAEEDPKPPVEPKAAPAPWKGLGEFNRLWNESLRILNKYP